MTPVAMTAVRDVFLGGGGACDDGIGIEVGVEDVECGVEAGDAESVCVGDVDVRFEMGVVVAASTAIFQFSAFHKNRVDEEKNTYH
jgi:hypothetical protein